MKTISAIYKGDRVVELLNDVDWPQDATVLVVIPDHEDELELHKQLQRAAEVVFAKLWDNNEDNVWNEYL
jgi:hypothetical protein